MSDEASLEGWMPEAGGDLSLAEVIDRAFDYRGDVTVVKTDGTRLEGYLFNRNRDVADPFVQMFDQAGDGPFTIRYADISTIRFTGKDTAAGKSYAAWLARKGQEKAARSARTDSPTPA